MPQTIFLINPLSKSTPCKKIDGQEMSDASFEFFLDILHIGNILDIFSMYREPYSLLGSHIAMHKHTHTIHASLTLH